MNFRLLLDAIECLETFDVHKVKRVYVQPDYSKLPAETKGCYVWSPFSASDIKKNFRTHLDILSQAQTDFATLYFPMKFEELKYFSDFDRVLVVIHAIDYSVGDYAAPKADIYYLRNENEREEKIDVYSLEERPFDEKIMQFKNPILFEGKNYHLVLSEHPSLAEIFHDIPTVKAVYKRLQEKVKELLK